MSLCVYDAYRYPWYHIYMSPVCENYLSSQCLLRQSNQSEWNEPIVIWSKLLSSQSKLNWIDRVNENMLDHPLSIETLAISIETIEWKISCKHPLVISMITSMSSHETLAIWWNSCHLMKLLLFLVKLLPSWWNSLSSGETLCHLVETLCHLYETRVHIWWNFIVILWRARVCSTRSWNGLVIWCKLLSSHWNSCCPVGHAQLLYQNLKLKLLSSHLKLLSCLVKLACHLMKLKLCALAANYTLVARPGMKRLVISWSCWHLRSGRKLWFLLGSLKTLARTFCWGKWGNPGLKCWIWGNPVQARTLGEPSGASYACPSFKTLSKNPSKVKIP